MAVPIRTLVVAAAIAAAATTEFPNMP